MKAFVSILAIVSLCAIPLQAADFIRADCNADGQLDISDPMTVLSYLFIGATLPDCLDACDVDDSNTINIADAISLFGYLFDGGIAPAPPFPACGPDPSPDALTCGSFSTCADPVLTWKVLPNSAILPS